MYQGCEIERERDRDKSPEMSSYHLSNHIML